MYLVSDTRRPVLNYRKNIAREITAAAGGGRSLTRPRSLQCEEKEFLHPWLYLRAILCKDGRYVCAWVFYMHTIVVRVK